MATKNVTTSTLRPLPFFGLAASYSIDPNNLPGDLADDATALLSSVHAVLDAVTDGLCDDGSQMQANPKDVAALLFGAQYQLRMVENLVKAIVPEVGR